MAASAAAYAGLAAALAAAAADAGCGLVLCGGRLAEAEAAALARAGVTAVQVGLNGTGGSFYVFL